MHSIYQSLVPIKQEPKDLSTIHRLIEENDLIKICNSDGQLSVNSKDSDNRVLAPVKLEISPKPATFGIKYENETFVDRKPVILVKQEEINEPDYVERKVLTEKRKIESGYKKKFNSRLYNGKAEQKRVKCYNCNRRFKMRADLIRLFLTKNISRKCYCCRKRSANKPKLLHNVKLIHNTDIGKVIRQNQNLKPKFYGENERTNAFKYDVEITPKTESESTLYNIKSNGKNKNVDPTFQNDNVEPTSCVKIEPIIANVKLEVTLSNIKVKPTNPHFNFEPTFSNVQTNLTACYSNDQPIFANVKIASTFLNNNVEPNNSNNILQQTHTNFNDVYAKLDMDYKCNAALTNYTEPLTYANLNTQQTYPTFNVDYTKFNVEPACTNYNVEPSYNNFNVAPSYTNYNVEPTYRNFSVQQPYSNHIVEPTLNHQIFSNANVEQIYPNYNIEPPFSNVQSEPTTFYNNVQPPFTIVKIESTFSNLNGNSTYFNNYCAQPNYNNFNVVPSFINSYVEPVSYSNINVQPPYYY